MGRDAFIYVELLGDELPGQQISADPLPPGAPETELGATHEINLPTRYYGPDYERGDWPMIAAALLFLHASDQVRRIWYGSEVGVNQITPEEVLELSRHYMEHGNRPW